MGIVAGVTAFFATDLGTALGAEAIGLSIGGAVTATFAVASIANLVTGLTGTNAGKSSASATPLPFPFAMTPADARSWLYGRGASGGVSQFLDGDA